MKKSLDPRPYTLFPKFGFTLVELLVVMAIIGILATVGLASYRTSQMKARDATRKNDLKQIQTALNLYQSIWQVLPDSNVSYQIVGCNTPPIACLWGETWSREGIIYMKPLPAEPVSSRPSYYYRKTGESAFILKATLENENDNDITESKARCGEGTGTEYVVCQE